VWAGVGADGGRGSGLEMLMSPAPRKRAMRRGGSGQQQQQSSAGGCVSARQCGWARGQQLEEGEELH
jgi:hypothetical protein